MAVNPRISRADFYVSPGGRDADPGSATKPFATIRRARDAVRERTAKGMKRDVTVILRGGRYFISRPIRFDERDAGRGKHRVVYRAASAEAVVIYGGRPVRPWKRWKGNIFRAALTPQIPPADQTGRQTRPVDSFPRLFEDGRIGVLARHPNKGSGYGGVRPLSATAVRIPRSWRNYDFDGASIFAWCGPNWFAERRKVTGVDRRTGTLTVEAFGPKRGRPNERMFIEGVLELLDEPGEWCLKAGEGYVYYRPRKLPIRNRLVVLTTTDRILDVRGRSMKRPVRNISFEGLTFIGTNVAGGGLIHIENARHIVVKSCKIIGAGHNGVHINKYAQNCTVYGCWIQGAGFAGVAMTGFAPGKGPFKSAAESYVNRKHLISNNFISDCGQIVGHGRGIEFTQSGHNEISHNLIMRMPRYGIAYGGIRYGAMPRTLYGRKVTSRNHYDFLHTRNNVIRFNDISTACRDSHDFGAIEAWGPGRDNLWECNAIHDIDPAVGWDGWAHALFPDDAADYHTLRKNVIYECKGGSMTGAVMMKSIGQVFENNIIADSAFDRMVTLEPYVEPAGKAVIRRNIFCGAGARIYSTNTKTSRAVGQIDYNLIHPACSEMRKYRARGWDAHSIHTDPMFDRKHPDYDTHFSDFKLKRRSPAFELAFEQIPVEKIGLKDDFPFDRKLIGRKQARDKIQAEDYDRIRAMRAEGATCICHIRPGAWAKYENVDFGSGRLNECVVRLSAPRGTRITFRLDKPDAPPIGLLVVRRGGWGRRRAKIALPKGVHALYLVFDPRGRPADTRVDWFRFREAPQRCNP